MAFLSLVTGVVDSTGERVDLPQTDGTYLPIRLKLGQNLSGTPATNGGQTDITINAATVNASYAQVQAALATADADLAVGNSYGVTADHFSSGSDPSLSGALRTSGGELVTYRDSGVDRTALQGSATTVTLGNADSDADVLIGTGKAFQVTLNGVGTQLEVADVVTIYHGSTTHATGAGQVGLDSTGHLTVWTGGAESSLVAQSDALSGDLGGTVANPSVVKLQGTTVSAAPPALGNVLTYNGSNWAPAAPSGGGGATLYPALDSHDLGYWDFSAASGNFANGGTGGAVPLVVTNVGSPGMLYGQASPLGSSFFMQPSGVYEAYCASAATSLCQPTAALTFTVVFQLRAYSGTYYPVWGSLNGGASPFEIYVYDAGSATRLHAQVKTVDQGQLTLDAPSAFDIALGQWTQIDVVYDGANAKLYKNGGLIKSVTATGGLVYSGTHQILAGALSSASTIQLDGFTSMMRIRDVALSAADVRLSYRHAMGWA
jgi:hypothetical protein